MDALRLRWLGAFVAGEVVGCAGVVGEAHQSGDSMFEGLAGLGGVSEVSGCRCSVAEHDVVTGSDVWLRVAGGGEGAALASFGAWTAVSGAIQLTLAIRLHRAQGRQLPLIVSGGLSTIAGIAFIAGSGMDHAHLAMVAGYMALGALLFLLSAVLTPTAAPTGR
jgi:hypothetical protein